MSTMRRAQQRQQQIELLGQNTRDKIAAASRFVGPLESVAALIQLATASSATWIHVRLDLPRLFVQVTDNGTGFSIEELEDISSNAAAVTATSASTTSVVSQLAHVATVEIVSCSLSPSAGEIECQSVVLSDSHPASVVRSSPSLLHRNDDNGDTALRIRTGTRIALHDIYRGFPVRQAQFTADSGDASRLSREIARYIEAISVIFPQISFRVNDVSFTKNSFGLAAVPGSVSSNGVSLQRISSIVGGGAALIGSLQRLRYIDDSNGYSFDGYYSAAVESRISKRHQCVYVDNVLIKAPSSLHDVINQQLRSYSSENTTLASPSTARFIYFIAVTTMGNIRQPSVLLDAPESGQLINSLRTAFVTHIVPAKCSVSTPSTVQPSRHPVGSSQSLLRQAFSEGSHRAVWSRRYGYTTGTSLTASLFLPSTTNTTGVRTMSSADIVQQQQQQQQQQRQRQQRQPSPSQIPTVFTPLTVQPSARRRLIPTGTTSEHFANTSSKVSSTPPDHQWQVECAPQITITKDQLAGRDPSVKLHVINQAYLKLILISLLNSADGSLSLVAVDQHAADERIRLELMILDIIEHARRVQSASAQSSDAIRTFEDNIEVRLSADVMEHDDGTGRLLDTLVQRLEVYGIYTIPLSDTMLCLTAAHVVYHSRLASDHQYASSFVDRVCCELINQPIQWKCTDYSNKTPLRSDDRWSSELLRFVRTCPRTIFDILCSRACHSAVRFEDKLNHSECTDLVQRLSNCVYPFQCAHGRPSVAPLARIKMRDSFPSPTSSTYSGYSQLPLTISNLSNFISSR